MIARRLPVVVVQMGCVLLAGCSAQEHGPRGRTGDSPSDSQAAATFSDEECNQFAQAWTEAVQARDATKLEAVLDEAALLRTAMADIGAADDDRKRFAAEMKGNPKKPGALAAAIFELVNGGASYKFLHRRTVQNRARLVFRILLPDGAELNYHDLLLE